MIALGRNAVDGKTVNDVLQIGLRLGDMISGKLCRIDPGPIEGSGGA